MAESHFDVTPCPRLKLRVADDDMEAHTLVKATPRSFGAPVASRKQSPVDAADDTVAQFLAVTVIEVAPLFIA
jgi:hypothetical protein